MKGELKMVTSPDLYGKWCDACEERIPPGTTHLSGINSCCGGGGCLCLDCCRDIAAAVAVVDFKL